ncbi:hypothetical protein E2562_012440 [Oryza meyeriana var. granulata]|uniref:Uncharacterized protein n=1 Tax=Oryza meyeriana var. granulata TaxID=110450 RepID=A0A6G1C5I1_9ORYZ|nr:hypothetical protein E2562_012440 [Oryza meyeriana var. granulata]
MARRRGASGPRRAVPQQQPLVQQLSEEQCMPWRGGGMGAATSPVEAVPVTPVIAAPGVRNELEVFL